MQEKLKEKESQVVESQSQRDNLKRDLESATAQIDDLRQQIKSQEDDLASKAEAIGRMESDREEMQNNLETALKVRHDDD